MNFRQLDLNLLRVLGAVYRCGSVTEAGRQLALSQPATSNALARLRRYFDDPLFVPSPGGLHPTRLARRIAPAVTALLRELEAELLVGESFDPATEAVRWRLSLSDLGEQLFLPRLAHLLRREAPSARLSNVSVPAERLPAALEAMEVDLAIGILNPQHRGVASEGLFHEHFVALSAAQWTPADASPTLTLTPAQLAQAALVVADPAATVHGSVTQMLATAAHRRRCGAAGASLRGHGRPGVRQRPGGHRAADVRPHPGRRARSARVGAARPWPAL
jgi:DNA-binding transcriptional LysR family regulator